jgi:hypothetical protein
MTARDTYNASIAAATAVKLASDLKAEMVRQEAINASGCNIGTTLQGGNAAYVAAVKTANAVKQASDLLAEQVKQSSHAAAKDTLRATDNGPF